MSDPIGLAGGINTYGYVGQAPTGAVDPSGEFFLVGAALGAVASIGIQAVQLQWSGCDIFDYKNYNWYDVGSSAAVGMIAPGWLSVVKTAKKTVPAIKSLSAQVRHANTTARAAKLRSRIGAHQAELAGVVVPQLGLQGVTLYAQELSNAGGANNHRRLNETESK